MFGDESCISNHYNVVATHVSCLLQDILVHPVNNLQNQAHSLDLFLSMFQKRSVTNVGRRRKASDTTPEASERNAEGKTEDSMKEEGCPNDAVGRTAEDDSKGGFLTDVQSKIHMVQQYQKLRQRTRGLQAVDEATKEVQKNLVSGSLNNTSAKHIAMLDKVFESQAVSNEEEVDHHFEEYLAARLKTTNPLLVPKSQKEAIVSHEELEKQLFTIPAHLQVKDQSQKEKDKVVWGVGLAEIPLTLEEKLRNIEETEKAKRRVLEKTLANPELLKNTLTDSEAVRTAFGQRFQTNELKKSSAPTDDAVADGFRKKTKLTS